MSDPLEIRTDSADPQSQTLINKDYPLPTQEMSGLSEVNTNDLLNILEKISDDMDIIKTHLALITGADL